MTGSLIARLKPLIILAAVVFLLLNIFLIRSYSDTVAAQKMAQAELSATFNQINQIGVPADLADITQAISEAQGKIKEREKNFPADPGGFDLLFYLSKAASESGVTISQLRGEPATEEKMALDYWATRYSLEVLGSASGITGFVERVEKIPQTTLTLDNVVLKPAGAQLMMSFQAVTLSREKPKASGSGPAAPPIRVIASPSPAR